MDSLAHKGISSKIPFTRTKKENHSLVLFLMCGRRESNPYASRHQILSLACLPISTRPQRYFKYFPFGKDCKCTTNYQICKTIYPSMYLLFGRKARSLAATAQITYVMRADRIITSGVAIPHDFTHVNTGINANICMRYIP